MNTIKIGLTGHTNGIGKVLFEELPYKVFGYSKSSGFDICKSSDRWKIIEESDSYDVFINNAFGGDFSQTKLLFELFQKWENKPKHIINIGSRAAEYCYYRGQPHMYSVEKLSLHGLIKQLQNSKRQCKVSNLAFSYVDTFQNQHLRSENIKMLSPHVAVDCITNIINANFEIIYQEVWSNP